MMCTRIDGHGWYVIHTDAYWSEIKNLMHGYDISEVNWQMVDKGFRIHSSVSKEIVKAVQEHLSVVVLLRT